MSLSLSLCIRSSRKEYWDLDEQSCLFNHIQTRGKPAKAGWDFNFVLLCTVPLNPLLQHMNVINLIKSIFFLPGHNCISDCKIRTCFTSFSQSVSRVCHTLKWRVWWTIWVLLYQRWHPNWMMQVCKSYHLKQTT